MTNSTDQADSDKAFRFDRGADWVRFSADFGSLCQSIGEQVRRTAAEIDVDSIVDEVQRALADVAAEAREAAANWRSSQTRGGPTRVRVDIRADAPSQSSASPATENRTAERKAVLDLLAQGKISAQDAARLLDALGS